MTGKTFSILSVFIAGLILSGCAHDVQNQQQPQGQGQSPQAKEESYELPITVKEAIQEYLPSVLLKSNSQRKIFCAYNLFGAERVQKNLYAYIWALCKEHYEHNGRLYTGSGVSQPIKIELMLDNGLYKVVRHDAPLDGALYADSIKKIFPSQYHEVMKLSDNDMKSLEEEVIKEAMEHFFGQYPVEDPISEGQLSKSTSLSSWMRYTNSVLGFEISFPYKGCKFTEYPRNSLSEMIVHCDGGDISIEVMSLDNSDDFLTSVLSNDTFDRDYIKIVDTQETTVGGKQAVKVVFQTKDQLNEGVLLYIKHPTTITKGSASAIKLAYLTKDEGKQIDTKQVDMFEKIVGTFKFVEN